MGGPIDELEDGHRDLIALLDAADRATGGPEVTLVLDALQTMLPAHFAAEEGPDGEIAGALDQPGTDQLAGELAREHVAIADALRALRGSADPERLRALTAAIRAHERRERGLRDRSNLRPE